MDRRVYFISTNLVVRDTGIELDKKMEKYKHQDDEVNSSFSPESDKNHFEGISTNNYTDSENLSLDDNDHVSCTGEEYIVHIEMIQ